MRIFGAFLLISFLIFTLYIRKNSVPTALNKDNSNQVVKNSIQNKAPLELSESDNPDLENEANQDLDDPMFNESDAVSDAESLEMERLEEIFSKVEQQWQEQAHEKLGTLGLNPKQIENYFSMRLEFEKDALKAVESFHQKMLEEKGPNYNYRITEFDELIMNKLRKEYYDKLTELIGEKTAREFVHFKDDYNEKIRALYPSVEEEFQIDF